MRRSAERPEDEYRRLRREEDNLLEEREDHRAALVRKALIFTPSALFFVGFWLWTVSVLVGGNPGALIGFIVLGAAAFALSYEALGALRDLRSAPTETSGRVQRVWTKARFVIFSRTGYMLVDKRVFEIGVDTSMILEPGSRVRIEHWPHTNSVSALYRDTTPAAPDAGGADVGGRPDAT